MYGKLILLRHGESLWNAKNLFTGWVDVDLSEKGAAEALQAGKLLMKEELLPDTLHTSLLRRAIKTAQIALDICERHWVPVKRSWRLNERHYGALQGKNKAQTLEEFGEKQFKLWRRSYDVAPPAISPDDEFSQAHDARYKELAGHIPSTECLKDVVVRITPYLTNEVAIDLRNGQNVMIAAHGNSIRAIVKHIDCISDEDISEVNIPTGIPLVYEFDKDFEPIIKGGRYLDPQAAQAAITQVANQGKK